MKSLVITVLSETSSTQKDTALSHALMLRVEWWLPDTRREERRERGGGLVHEF